MPSYDYLTERFQLGQLLQAPVRVVRDPVHLGAQVIQAKIADHEIVVTVTDTQRLDPATGEWVHTLTGWPLEQRRAYSDLHWVVDVFQPGQPRLARQQAADTEHQSLIDALREAMCYALERMEPQYG